MPNFQTRPGHFYHAWVANDDGTMPARPKLKTVMEAWPSISRRNSSPRLYPEASQPLLNQATEPSVNFCNGQAAGTSAAATLKRNKADWLTSKMPKLTPPDRPAPVLGNDPKVAPNLLEYPAMALEASEVELPPGAQAKALSRTPSEAAKGAENELPRRQQ